MTEETRNVTPVRPARPPTSYRLLVGVVRSLVGLFFRRIETKGLENVPREGGGVLVAWHPNGMVDPALVLATFPRQVVFGARHGLFRWPLLGAWMRVIGTVPIYRRQDFPAGDDDARKQANEKSLDAMAQVVAGGAFSALFPEGVSHDAPHLMALRAGAARLFESAVMHSRQSAATLPVVIPVGLHYDDKTTFRSNALVAFHPPIVVPPELFATLGQPASEDERKERSRELTQLIESALERAVHPTETWQLNQLMHRTAELLRAEREHRADEAVEEVDLGERMTGFERVWLGYNALRESHPEQTERMLERVRTYSAKLRALGLREGDLSRSPALLSRSLFLVLLLQVVLVLLLLPPLVMVGYVINAPVYVGMKVVARIAAKQKKDSASIKLLGSMVLYPAAWLLAAALVFFGHVQVHQYFARFPTSPWWSAGATLILGVLGAVVALRYLELSQLFMRNLRVRWQRGRMAPVITELLEERAALHDKITAMASGLDLPGGPDPLATLPRRSASG